jgi:hypothetical protein
MPLFKLGGSTGGVTSVGLTAPSSILAVTGSPVTTAGVLALALVTQAANLVWAGPATGAAADPTFRSLVAADIPDLSGVYQPLSSKLTAFAALTNAAGVLTNDGSGVYSWAAASTGTVTSVALTVPSFLNVAGSPVTTSGTFAVTLATQTANTVFAGPGTGLPATPAFRALVAADIPDLSGAYQPLNAKLTAISALANAAGVLTNDGSGVFSYTTPTTGTVTSVALAAPAIFSVTGTPVTTSGTLTLSLATQTANVVFAGPGTGLPAAPTFRALVVADIPDLSGAYQPLNAKLTAIAALANAAGALTNNGAGVFSYVVPTTGTVTSVAMTVPSFLSVAGSPITGSGTLAVTLATETANFVFAGPTTGAAATPTFRALVAADFPSIPATTFTMATARILGRTTAGTGVVEELTAGTSLSLGSGSLNTIQDIRTSATPQWTRLGIGQAADATTSLVVTTNTTAAPAGLSGTVAQVVGADGTTARLFVDAFAGTPALNLRRANTTNAAKSAVVTDDQIGSIGAIGYGATGYASGGRANILFCAAQNWSDTVQGTYIAFYTTPTGSTTNAEKMRLDASGNLGIGTSPSAKLDVVGAGNFTGASAGLTVAVPAGGGGIALNASTGTANTGMNITWQRGASSKWNLGTGISLGSDVFELYDRANGVSVIAVTPSTGATAFTGLVTGSIGFLSANNQSYSFKDSGGASRRTALWSSGNNIYYGDVDNSNNSNILILAGGTGTIGFYTNNTIKVSISNTGRVSTVEAIATAAPVSGTAGAWKFGIAVGAAVTFNTGNYVQLDVNGTLYKLAVCN